VRDAGEWNFVGHGRERRGKPSARASVAFLSGDPKLDFGGPGKDSNLQPDRSEAAAGSNIELQAPAAWLPLSRQATVLQTPLQGRGHPALRSGLVRMMDHAAPEGLPPHSTDTPATRPPCALFGLVRDEFAEFGRSHRLGCPPISESFGPASLGFATPRRPPLLRIATISGRRAVRRGRCHRSENEYDLRHGLARWRAPLARRARRCGEG